MNYSKLSREELIEVIDELQMLNKELLNEKIQANKLEFAWIGNLGNWYLNLKTKNVVFNPLKIEAMGYTMDELPEKIKYTFFTDKLHPDDHKNTMDAMMNHMKGEAKVYECEYRIQTKDGSYKWFYDRGKITQRSESGKPEFVAGIVFDITEKKEQELRLSQINEFLEIQSSTDSLTGILNRRAIMEESERRKNQALEQKTPLSIALFDIDFFKKINDTYGHQFGDEVLKTTANIISESLRETDSVGRYGGEEFLAVFPNTEKSKALLIAERIREAVEAFDFPQNAKVTISAGVSVFEGVNISDTINEADKNLYKAKNDGRNKVKA